jgi:hypothetical protein
VMVADEDVTVVDRLTATASAGARGRIGVHGNLLDSFASPRPLTTVLGHLYDHYSTFCLPGNWNDDVPGDAQLGGALELVTWLRGLLPWATVVGHRDVALSAYPTTCPGATFPAWRSVLT